MTARAERFPLFDGLRAIAALSVLVFHASYAIGFGHQAIGRGSEVLRPYVSRLDVGVTIFFLVSGFLLYRPFVKARMRGEPLPSPAAYGWRRFLRIVPAYWVALTVIALALSLPKVFTAAGIPIYYGFAQIYNAAYTPGGISQAWTLAVEITFYAFLPLWALAIHRLTRKADAGRILRVELWGLAGLFGASMAYKVWALATVDPASLGAAPYVMPLPNFLDHFALGMALAVLSVWWEGREPGTLPGPVRAVLRFPALAWLGAAVAFWAVSTQIGYTGELLQDFSRRMFLGRHVLYGVVAFLIVLPAVFWQPERGVVRRLLGRRWLLYVGLVSYGVYLYHLAVLVAIDRLLGDTLRAAISAPGLRYAVVLVLGTLGAVAVGSVSYYAVERPALRLKRLVSGRPAPAPGEATAEPAPAAPPTPSRAG